MTSGMDMGFETPQFQNNKVLPWPWEGCGCGFCMAGSKGQRLTWTPRSVCFSRPPRWTARLQSAVQTWGSPNSTSRPTAQRWRCQWEREDRNKTGLIWWAWIKTTENGEDEKRRRKEKKNCIDWTQDDKADRRRGSRFRQYLINSALDSLHRAVPSILLAYTAFV